MPELIDPIEFEHEGYIPPLSPAGKLEHVRKLIEGAYESPSNASVGVEELTFDELEVELSKALHLIEEIYDVLRN